MGLPAATAEELLKKLKEFPMLGARRVLVEGSADVELTTTPTRVPHGLGRESEGLVVTRQDVAGNVLTLEPDAVTPPADPTRDLVLAASAGTIVVRLLAF